MIHTKNFKTGLIGKKLGHSFSPQIHSYIADYEYKLYEMEEEEVGDFLKNCPLDALNVTIPYKKTVMPFLTHISEIALKIGSVNTIVKKSDGLYGYNTDYYGFSYMLNVSGIEVKDKKVLVLGSGGASLTVIAVLKDLGAKEIITISRSGENNYDNIEFHADADVIVNTTPVGMYPNNGLAPVDLTVFKKLSGVLDLIYNPSVTKLLYDAEKLGIPNINGLSMLSAQAKRAAELFLDIKIEKDPTPEIVRNIEAELKNIVLIGMPGCGKSTLGKALAEKLSRPFIDTDEIIARNSDMSIPEIFSLYGEEDFRKRETKAAREAGKATGTVIATGGGIVTKEENYYPLHQNSTIIYLDRDIALLPKDGRPLSQKNDLRELFEKRSPLYEKFADTKIGVCENTEETVNSILRSIAK
ncbi:MAG: AAA family ATPase [Clostridia bacterium]|nr:AAA family ATPase [Clostridia bacterium]